jgi:hypothetical protein
VITFSDVYDKLTGGTVGNWLAIVGVLSLIYWAWRIFTALQNRQTHAPPATDAPDMTAPRAADAPYIPAARSATAGEEIAVIAAAVHAMLGTRRIVHIEVNPIGQTWAIEGRWSQQTSHQPR